MGNLMQISREVRRNGHGTWQSEQQPTNNGCYAWQNEQSELDRWDNNNNITRERQLGQLFNTINLQPQRAQPGQSSLGDLSSMIAAMFRQCGIGCQFDTVEFHDTTMAFVFFTHQNMMADNAVIATQFAKEQLQQQIGKTVSTGIKPHGQQYQIIVWVWK